MHNIPDLDFMSALSRMWLKFTIQRILAATVVSGTGSPGMPKFKCELGREDLLRSIRELLYTNCDTRILALRMQGGRYISGLCMSVLGARLTGRTNSAELSARIRDDRGRMRADVCSSIDSSPWGLGVACRNAAKPE